MKKNLAVIALIITLLVANVCLASSVQIHPPWGQDGNMLFVRAFGKDRYLIVKTRTSAAIQAAITALGAEGGEIVLPEGTYTVNTALTATCNSLVISGSGDGTKLVLGADDNLFYMNDVDHLTLKDLLIDGSDINTTDKALVYLYGSYNKYSFYNVTFQNFSDFALSTYNTNNNDLIVSGCTFKNTSTYFGDARAIYVYSARAYIHNNIFDWCGCAIYCESVGGIPLIIDNNYFNRVHSTTYKIIYIDNDGCKVTNNYFDGCRYGLYLDGSDQFIHGNQGTIDAFGYYGFYAVYLINGDYSIISENNFTKFARYTLQIKDSNYVTIRDNTLKGSVTGALDSAIYLENCDYPDIVNNTTYNVDWYFVTTDADSDYWRIYDNITDKPNSVAVGSLPGTLDVYSKFQAQRAAVDVKTDNYVILATDLGKTLVMNSADDKTFSLPSVGAADDGAMLYFSKIGAGKLTIDAADTDLIEDSGAGDGIYNQAGASRATLTLRYSDADTTWYITDGKGTWVTYD